MSRISPHRAGFVTLAGRTNVGKSTLLNRLVGQKVAIVTPKPQTTRRRITGIRTDDDAQIIFIDTPGLHDSRRLLNRRMVETARRCMAEGEVIAAVVEARDHLTPEDRSFLEGLAELQTPTVVIINKIDLVSPAQILPLADAISHTLPRAEIVPVSALSGKNFEELLRVLKQMLPESPALMPEEEYTDQTERMLAAEVIREKIFLTMRQEVPFSTAVDVEAFVDEPERNLTRIVAVIIVERDSHKGMIIGAGGRQLKEIGMAARLDLEKILDRHLFLELRVKVERGWTSDPRKLKELGF